jgi:hypothetical protein
MSLIEHPRIELGLAIVLTVVGIVMTTWAVLSHAALLVAPGALFITVGGAWTGNAMARHGVHLIPTRGAGASEVDG